MRAVNVASLECKKYYNSPEPTYNRNPNLESTKDKLLLVQFSVVVDVQLLEHLRCSLFRHVLRVVLAILLLLDDNSE